MEVHGVWPEERARDEQGKTLPWGYRYLDSSRNFRNPAEETGPFGRHRDVRYTGSLRPSRGRTATTPLRKEDPTVAEFGRLLGMQQQKEEAQRSKDSTSPPNGTRPVSSEPPPVEKEKVATEVMLFGYASKDSEWRVISKYERIVQPQGFICEDYDREDPTQPLTSTFHFPSLNTPISRGSLTKDGLKKSRKYRGGAHWIKVTFDSYESAERAVFYSPQEIENHLVFAQMWNGQPPFSDVAIPKASQLATDLQRQFNAKLRTLTTSDSNSYLAAAASTAELHGGAQTLPRSFIAPNSQYAQPQDDSSISTSTTASSATATNAPLTSASTTSLPPPPLSSSNQTSSLRSQSTPNLLTTNTAPSTPRTHRSLLSSSHPSSVRRATLRPISEALPPQPSITERALRNIPVVNWFVPNNNNAAGKPVGGGEGGIGQDVLTNDKGEFDWERNGVYWRVWGTVDYWVGSDLCGLKND